MRYGLRLEINSGVKRTPKWILNKLWIFNSYYSWTLCQLARTYRDDVENYYCLIKDNPILVMSDINAQSFPFST